MPASPEVPALPRGVEQPDGARLVQVFEQAPVAVVVVRGRVAADLVFELANPRYLEMLPPGRVPVGRRIADVLPELSGELLAALQGVLDTGQPFVANDYPLPLDRDGDGMLEEYYFSFVYHPLVEPDGTVGGVVGVGTEVTDTVRARLRAEESERRFRETADAAPVLIWTAGTDARCDWFNQPWLDFTGRPMEAELGNGWAERVHPDDFDRCLGIYLGAFHARRPFTMEYRLQRHDGAYRWLLDNAVPRFAKDGTSGGTGDGASDRTFVGYIGTCVDITDQRSAREEAEAASAQLQEQALELELANERLVATAAELEERTADAERAREAAERAAARTALLQILTDALSRALSREDVAAVVLERVASAFGAHLGVLALLTPEGDRLAVAAAERLRRDTWQAWQTFSLDAPVPLAEAARERRTIALPTFEAIAMHAPAVAEMCRDYGTHAMCVVPVIATGGETLGALGLSFPASRPFDPETLALLDTLARQAAQALERAQLFEATQVARVDAERHRAEAEAANAAKSLFLSTMSHELRTPLNAIGGYIDLLTLGLRGPLTEAQRQDLERVRLANQHLMSLVTDVLNFARLDAGQIEFRLADVELASIVAHLEPLMMPQLAAKRIRFDHDGCAPDTPDEPHRVRADPEKLRQILLNLLTNALKFTDVGGHVAIACETDREAGLIRVRVTDTGRGIPAHQLGHIFEPFVQIDRHRTQESQQGVGLGLAISRDLARGMGGELTAESTPGLGSTFTLTLPAAP